MTDALRRHWPEYLMEAAGLAAAEVHRARGGRTACAKLHHDNPRRCIFCAHERAGARPAAA